METIEIDPKMFISPPYIKCPKCGEDLFGILMICDHHYSRRCKNCLYPKRDESSASYPLPELNKKIIYIDQFAISNMMKILNPDTSAYKKGTLDNFWLTLFEKLDSLCKLQLILCPYSNFHTSESLVSPYFEPLKRMYELLSCGVSFYDHEVIKETQIYEHATNWITNNADKKLDLDINSVITGKINVWQSRFIISVDIQYKPDLINELLEYRKKIHDGLSKIFIQWQSEKNKNFDTCFKEESLSWGNAVLHTYINYINRIYQTYNTNIELTANALFTPPPAFNLIHSIGDAFRENGVQDSDIWHKTVEYLTSTDLKDIPFIKISSMLYAAIARKTAAGKKKPLNQGMADDIKFISVLLPYCDAMFIDKECHSYLKEKPLSESIGYGTKIFSLNNKAEFINYLNEIENTASQKHLTTADELYGKSWREPYKTLYIEQKEK